jgi:uncharacterized repeat protein (TIGR03803 family)
MNIRYKHYFSLSLISGLLLAGCGGGSSSPATYTVSGTVTGLASGQSVTILNSGGDPQKVTANTGFSFDAKVTQNGSYAVTIYAQPTGQVCTVSNGSGSGVVANISNVAVTCSTDTYSIAGNVTGLLSGATVTLLNNAADPQTISANGEFDLAVPVSYNGSYAVTVGTQPSGQVCTVSNATGAGVVADIKNVAVSCSTDTYSLSANVSGLSSGQQVTLLNNGADPVTVTANGAMTFDVPVAYGSGYAVTVATQPVGEICTANQNSGTNVTGNITDVTVTCSVDTYTIGGTLNGLSSGGQVTLENNGADLTVLSANAPFTFSVPVAYNTAYAVAVATQPLTQTCTVTNPGASSVTANVGNVGVTCSSYAELTLHSFQNNSADGGLPQAALLQAFNGTMYGVTFAGGANSQGTIFSVSPAGVETALYSFGAAGDGANPFGSLIVGADGNFYGTTVNGGQYGGGTVFKVTSGGVETVVHSFGNGQDGQNPYGNLVLASDGNFYGTTAGGGVNGEGTVFKLTPQGVETVLHSFDSSAGDAYHSVSGLLQASDGNLYGTSQGGGANNAGAVFKISLQGVESVLHSFAGGSDGAGPTQGLIQGVDGSLYGTTGDGGSGAAGVLYKITLAGRVSIIYTFGQSYLDGEGPNCTLVQGSDGNFYGTTQRGGANFAGTIFEVTPAGSETVLYSFGNTPGDGLVPSSGLIYHYNGHFFGTTSAGGTNNSGTVFKF